MSNLLTGDVATFDASIGSWNEAQNNANFAASWSAAEGGVLQIDVTTGGANISLTSHANDNTSKVPCTPGQTLTASVDVKQTVGVSSNVRVDLTFFDATETALIPAPNFVIASDGTAASSAWQTFGGDVVVPAGAAFCRMRVVYNTPAAGDQILMDNAVIDDGVGAPPAATVTRVQVGKAGAYLSGAANVTSQQVALPEQATAGNLLLAAFVVDKDSGAFTPPAGFTLVPGFTGTTTGAQQVSLHACYKFAAGDELALTGTWATVQDGAAALVVEYDGVDGADPFGPVDVPAYDNTARTSLSLNPAAAEAAGLCLALLALDSEGTVVRFDPSATGWTLVETASAVDSDATATGGRPPVALLEYDTPLDVGTDVPASSFTWTESDQAAGAAIVLNAGAGAAPTAVLEGRIVGVPTGGTGRVGVKVANASSVRLKVGTDAAVTAGVVFGSAVAPDARGVAQLTVDGLAAGTDYFYRVAMTPSAGGAEVLDGGAVGRFRTPPAGVASFSFSFGSCDDAPDASSWSAIAGQDDDLFFHLGDWPHNPAATSYADGTATTVQAFRDDFHTKIEAPNHAAVFSTRATTYTPSDHDGHTNNGTAGGQPTAWANWNTAYREVFPTPALPAGGSGVYYAFSWGRVRFVQIDTRSFASVPSATDDASKTRLGATQKQWLKDEITAATEPVIVILNADPWIGAAEVGDDAWLGYTTERTELASFFTASGKNIAILGGDMHAVAGDDGTNSPGGVAVFHGSPLENSASTKGGPYTAGPYPASGNAVVRQYGRVVVTDTGSQVELAFTGYSADGTARVAVTKQYAATAPVTGPRAVEQWNGTALVARVVEQWTGSALVTRVVEGSTGVVEPPADPVVLFPANAGHVDVTTAYSAAGDGVADDTAALLAAFTDNDYIDAETTHVHIERPSARTVYLPEGTYRITGPLVIPGSSVRIVGAGQGRTIIKLDDSAAGFGSAASPEYVLRFGTSSLNLENAGFANYLEDLTIDAGSGNPGAIGCRYSVANSGSMRRVTITGDGKYGLMFGTAAGPGYVADVTVVGFDYGIRTEESDVNDIVFSGITLTDQTVAGISHTAKSLVFEDLTISGAPLAIDVADAAAQLLITTLSLAGPGSGPAISLAASAYLWVRDVTASGWTNLITEGATARFVGAGSITEWASANYQRGNTSVAWTESSGHVGLNLPRLRAPEYVNDNLAQWACPQDFGYVAGDVGPALQAAIDSGAKVVYLPYARYTLSTPVVLRGAVRKLDCMFSVLERQTGGSLTVGDTADGVCIVEHLVPGGQLTTLHDSSGTVVCRDYGNRNSKNTAVIDTGPNATGDLFYESAGSNQHLVVSRPINVWVRQMNREQAVCNISGGATVLVIGDNVELQAVDVSADFVIDGSTVEIIGAAFDVLDFPGAYPATGKAAFRATDSTISVVTGGYLRGTGPSTVDHWVSDEVAGVPVGDVFAADAYEATTGTNRRVVVPLYVSP